MIALEVIDGETAVSSEAMMPKERGGFMLTRNHFCAKSATSCDIPLPPIERRGSDVRRDNEIYSFDS